MLTEFNIAANVSWRFEFDSGDGLAVVTQGRDKKSYSMRGLDVTTYDEAIVGVVTLGGTDNELTIDLWDFVNRVSEETGLSEALAIYLQTAPVDEEETDCSVIFGPASSGGFQWFFGGLTNSITLSYRDCLVKPGPAEPDGTSGPGYAVTSTTGKLTFRNPGSHDIELFYAIMGRGKP